VDIRLLLTQKPFFPKPGHPVMDGPGEEGRFSSAVELSVQEEQDRHHNDNRRKESACPNQRFAIR
jgi:hypothetical protein